MTTLTLDHVYPQDCGGPDDPLNLAACCASCNNEKANLKPEDWFRLRPTALGAFVLLAVNVDTSWRRLAADMCESPYRDELLTRLPRALRTPRHLGKLESELRLLLNH